jgi:hypothetical protein
MSIEILSNSGGILVARITGLFTQPELAALQAAATEAIRQHGRVRMLVMTEDFRSWRQGDDWSDVSFMENDPFIQKMAIVGEKQWEEQALVFTAKMVRQFPIKYFLPPEIDLAKAWLASD